MENINYVKTINKSIDSGTKKSSEY